MDEYIKRKAVYDAFYADDTLNGYEKEYCYEIIKAIPATDVAPVRHARWEWCKGYDGDSILVCSECGRVCYEEDAPYCYCGATMDLEE